LRGREGITKRREEGRGRPIHFPIIRKERGKKKKKKELFHFSSERKAGIRDGGKREKGAICRSKTLQKGEKEKGIVSCILNSQGKTTREGEGEKKKKKGKGGNVSSTVMRRKEKRKKDLLFVE